jgi:hypothetical protein
MFQVVRSCRRAVSAESDERTAATCHTDPTVGTDAARLPEVVPGLVELEVAVPHLRLAEW